MKTLRRHERSVLRKKKLPRVRENKSSGQEVEVEGSPPEAEAGPSVPKVKVARTSEVPELAPWRAPVARMY